MGNACNKNISVETARLFNQLEVYEVPVSADDENLSIHTSRLQHLGL
jgi:hypothetical protein